MLTLGNVHVVHKLQDPYPYLYFIYLPFMCCRTCVQISTTHRFERCGSTGSALSIFFENDNGFSCQVPHGTLLRCANDKLKKDAKVEPLHLLRPDSRMLMISQKQRMSLERMMPTVHPQLPAAKSRCLRSPLESTVIRECQARIGWMERCGF